MDVDRAARETQSKFDAALLEADRELKKKARKEKELQDEVALDLRERRNNLDSLIPTAPQASNESASSSSAAPRPSAPRRRTNDSDFQLAIFTGKGTKRTLPGEVSRPLGPTLYYNAMENALQSSNMNDARATLATEESARRQRVGPAPRRMITNGPEEYSIGDDEEAGLNAVRVSKLFRVLAREH
jgi:hypothetical protein